MERTEIISCGKQSDLGLNLTKNTRSVAGPLVDLDLTEWTGHRILGAKGDYYYSGVIRHVSRDTRDITVILDGDTQPTLYRDVLSPVHVDTDTCPPVISDVTPTTDQVNVGSKLCVLLDSQRNIFVPGLVYEISRHQTQSQFLVKLQTGDRESGEKAWVKRSQLRLTSVPWAEELAAATVAAKTGNVLTPGDHIPGPSSSLKPDPVDMEGKK